MYLIQIALLKELKNYNYKIIKKNRDEFDLGYLID